MLELLNLENVLFLDIETVPMVPTYDDLTPSYKKHWDRKADFMPRRPEDTPKDMFVRAGIYAEFGKVICISVGSMKYSEGRNAFKLKSFYGDDEKVLLTEFVEMMNKQGSRKEPMLCGHNIKEFDIPFLSRRLLVNGIRFPSLLDLAGKKPWEVSHMDTMELWKFGDYKNFTSLDLLATIFNIPTPKDDIDGSDVARVYYEEKNIERIKTYCQKDVVTVAQLMLKYQGKPLIKEEDISVA
jgi:3'-5' exonuclease